MAEFVLHPIHLEKLATEWLLEDSPNFDYGGAVAAEKKSIFEIIYKTKGGIFAGIPFADAVFARLGLDTPTWHIRDGDSVREVPKIVCTVSGSARHLLLAERVVLNVLSRASGIATVAADMKSRLKDVKWTGCLAGTRKTTPGFRMVEKYALIVSGVDTHRYDLSSMVMLKDNHLALSGSISEAVREARALCGFTQKIEVECNSLEQAIEAANAGCDIIMLDNFEPKVLHSTAECVKKSYPNILIEASGGIQASNVSDYASQWVNIISSSALVQGYRTMDLSMKVVRKGF